MKTLIGQCDSFQLEPFAYPWAWDMARECEQNTWTPEEIPVAADVAIYKNPGTPPEARDPGLEHFALLRLEPTGSGNTC